MIFLKQYEKHILSSSLLACRNIAKKYKVWDRFSSKAPANLKEVSRYLNQQLKLLEKEKIDFDKLPLVKDIDLLLRQKE